jgi:hypothetical protein
MKQVSLKRDSGFAGNLLISAGLNLETWTSMFQK